MKWPGFVTLASIPVPAAHKLAAAEDVTATACNISREERPGSALWLSYSVFPENTLAPEHYGEMETTSVLLNIAYNMNPWLCAKTCPSLLLCTEQRTHQKKKKGRNFTFILEIALTKQVISVHCYRINNFWFSQTKLRTTELH